MTQTTTGERLYKIGEVADDVGITQRTIRYYEELGLLGADRARLKGSHRLFTDADIARLRELVRLRNLLGLSLEELTQLAEAAQVSQYLRLRWETSTEDAERTEIIEAAIPNVERQLELVHARQRSLAEFAAELTDKLARMRERLADVEKHSPVP
jgi:MerR family transcriptional regulator, repressor of the yfmOP operon